MTGPRVSVDEALQAGLIHEVADSEAAMMAQAKAWILANPGVKHPWDQPHEPGADRMSLQSQSTIASIAPWLRKTVGPANNAAARIADIAVESLSIDFDTASQIETRGFVELVVSDDAHAKISSFFEANRRRAG